MKVWAIYPLKAWAVMQHTGVLRCREDRIDLPEVYLPAYDWLSKQMRQRIGAPPEGVRYPVWSWLRQLSLDRARPDLRAERYRWPHGELLLSNFEMWHCVLNWGYLPVSEADDERFDAIYGQVDRDDPTPEYRHAVERSWERISAIDAVYGDDEWGSPDQRSIQATCWEIRLEQVRQATPFVGAMKWAGATGSM